MESEADFTTEHRKGSLNCQIPDALSRVHMDELQRAGAEDYVNLVQGVDQNLGKSPDLQTSEGYVYKRMGLCLNDAVDETRTEALGSRRAATRFSLESTSCHNRRAWGVAQITSQIKTVILLARDDCRFPKRSKGMQGLLDHQDRQQKLPITHWRTTGYGASWPKVVHRLYGTIPEDQIWEFCDFCVPRPFLQFCLAAADETCSSHQIPGDQNFHQYGVPEFIHSDNGKQFVSQIFGELMTPYGIRHVKTGLYSPQANPAERVKRSVLQILRATIATDQRNWNTQLNRIEGALRNGLHESIGLEPYYAMFGTGMVTHGTAYPILRKLGEHRQEIHR